VRSSFFTGDGHFLAPIQVGSSLSQPETFLRYSKFDTLARTGSIKLSKLTGQELRVLTESG
jgi:hypothetical protein